MKETKVLKTRYVCVAGIGVVIYSGSTPPGYYLIALLGTLIFLGGLVERLAIAIEKR